MNIFLKFISWSRRIILNRFRIDSGSLNIRKTRSPGDVPKFHTLSSICGITLIYGTNFRNLLCTIWSPPQAKKVGVFWAFFNWKSGFSQMLSSPPPLVGRTGKTGGNHPCSCWNHHQCPSHSQNRQNQMWLIWSLRNKQNQCFHCLARNPAPNNKQLNKNRLKSHGRRPKILLIRKAFTPRVGFQTNFL